jgi:superfamily II DNA helicase RecQ
LIASAQQADRALLEEVREAIATALAATGVTGGGLVRQGLLQVLGGLALSLIALFSSYDHVTLLGRTLQLQQQWGIVFIAASLATVVVDAELASGSRLRAAQDAARVADEAARERYRADRERNQADRERNRAAEARERQRESFERLDQAALLSARVQLDPSVSNRARLQAFLALMGQQPLEDDQGI